MPDEQQQTSASEKPTAQPEGEKPQGASGKTDGAQQQTEQTKPADFEAWLAAQPDEIRELYETHTNGLKSALDKERKANKKRDDEAIRKEQEARDAQLSEADKASKKIAQLEQERNELQQAMRLIQAREALAVAAEKEKIEFASPQAMRDAFEIALQAAEFDDEGKLQGALTLLKASIKDRDYLLKKQATPPPAGDTNVNRRTTNQTDPKEREAELRARYRLPN